MILFLQLLLNGLSNGAIYALMAVGFAIIYNATHVFHLAHGAVFTFAAYIFYVLVAGLGLSWYVAAVPTLIGAMALGALIEFAIYTPLRARGAGQSALMIASLGILVFLQSIFAIVFSTDVRTVRSGGLSVYEIGELTITSLHLAIGAIAVLVFILLQAFLSRSRYGRAIRALSDNPSLAAVVGIDMRNTFLIVTAIGSALAGIAAILISLDLGVEPTMGFLIVFFSALAVVVGGAGYLPGALLGAFVVGILQQLTVWQIDSRWQNGLVFGVVLIFLCLRPQGVFGSKLNVRKA